MPDLMALGIPIRADDKEALSAFRNVERAGQQVAAKLTVSLAQASGALKMLGIEARTASVNGIERIVVNARQLDQANGILLKMGTGFKAIAVEATRAAQATQQVAQAAKVGGQSYQRWGNAAIRGAGALMLMGDALDGNDKSMQQLLRTGSSIAFMFGPMGAIVGSLGIVASFFVKAFDKAQEAIRKTKEETQKLIEAGKELTSAPGFASLGSARELGFRQNVQLANLRKEVADAEAQNALAQKQWRTARVEPGEAIGKPVSKERIKDLKAQIAELEKVTTATVRLGGVLSTYEASVASAADAEKARDEATKERARIIEGEIGWLRQLNELGSISFVQVNRARELEIQYRVALQDTSLTIEQQIALIKKRNDALAATATVWDMGKLGGDLRRGEDRTGAIGLGGGAASAVDRNIAEALKRIEDPAKIEAAMRTLGEAGAEAFASGLGQGISSAFDTLFSGGGIFKGIEELGKGLLASFGRLLQQFGIAALAANQWIMGIFAGLGGPMGIAAAVGLIALGSVLSALGGKGGRGGGGLGRTSAYGGSMGSGGGGMADSLTTYRYNSRTADVSELEPVAPITIISIGTKDIAAQNDLYDMVDSARRRRGKGRG